MNKYILISLVLIINTVNIYSQEYKSLKNKDTVYFYFDYSKQFKKKIK